MSLFSYTKTAQEKPALGLNRVLTLAGKLGNPQDKINTVHIAGTNGKGSVAAFTYSMLNQAGFKAGRFVSPFLNNANESILIGSTPIADHELKKILAAIGPCINETNAQTGQMLTQFEIMTVCAFIHFKNQACDFCIIETGMGGADDATNIISKPLVSVLTPISIDHSAYLGNTVEEIAGVKAGIIKQNSPLVTAQQASAAMAIIQSVCRKKSAMLYTVDSDAVESLGFNGIFEKFKYDNLIWESGLAGYHQVNNAALALEAIGVLQKQYGLAITQQNKFNGIKRTVNPARFEILCQDPLVFFDGAHNAHGMGSLNFNLNRYFKNKKISFLLAFMADKDADQMIDTISETGFRFVATEVPDNPRSLPCGKLYALLKEKSLNAYCEKDIENAINVAKNDADILVICGSLYLYKHIMGFFEQ